MKLKFFLTSVVLSFISILLIGEAFFIPVLGILLFIALIPLYIAFDIFFHVSMAGNNHIKILGRSFLLGYLFGIILFGIGFFWLTKLSFGLTFFAVAYSAVFFGLCFTACVYVKMKNPQVPWYVVVAISWTVFEYLRGNFLFSFTGASLGYGLVYYTSLIQGAKVVGLYGITFAIVLINGLIFEIIREKPGQSKVTHLLIFLLLLNLISWYGEKAMHTPLPSMATIKVAAVQASLPKEIHSDYAQRLTVMRAYGDLAKIAAHARPSLIIFPEATMPGDLLDPRGKDIKNFYRDVAEKTKSFLLIGVRHDVIRQGKRSIYNSAYLFHPQGCIVGMYDKMKLVPFFERVDFSDQVGFLKKFRLRELNFDPGKNHTVFKTPWGRFSTLICFESIFPDFTRQFVQHGAQFLVNISNDDDLGNDWQAHCFNNAMSVFRAIENERFLIRCSRWGIGLLIDPYGKVLKKIPFGLRASMISEIRLIDYQTPYTRFGDFIVLFSALSLLILVLKAMFFPVKN